MVDNVEIRHSFPLDLGVGIETELVVDRERYLVLLDKLLDLLVVLRADVVAYDLELLRLERVPHLLDLGKVLDARLLGSVPVVHENGLAEQIGLCQLRPRHMRLVVEVLPLCRAVREKRGNDAYCGDDCLLRHYFPPCVVESSPAGFKTASVHVRSAMQFFASCATSGFSLFLRSEAFSIASSIFSALSFFALGSLRS